MQKQENMIYDQEGKKKEVNRNQFQETNQMLELADMGF